MKLKAKNENPQITPVFSLRSTSYAPTSRMKLPTSLVELPPSLKLRRDKTTGQVAAAGQISTDY